MNDLDKLMKKLKKDDPVEEKPAPVEDEDDEDDEDEEETSQETVTNVETDGTEIPEDQQDPMHTVEAEVGILQNNGIFRRELLAIKREQVDVLKVMAQLLIDIKKDGKNTKK